MHEMKISSHEVHSINREIFPCVQLMTLFFNEMEMKKCHTTHQQKTDLRHCQESEIPQFIYDILAFCHKKITQLILKVI